MADHIQAIRILGGNDGQRGVVLNDKAGIHYLAIDLASQSRLCQARANRSSNLGHRDRAGILALGAIGERDVDHEIPCQTKFLWVKASAKALELPESKKRGTSPRFDEGVEKSRAGANRQLPSAAEIHLRCSSRCHNR